MRWKPNSTVATIVQDGDKFLLVEEIDKTTGKHVFNQPAGHLEEDESLVEAALRECLEETGYEVQITHYQGLYTYYAEANGVTYHRHCFVADVASFDETASLDEGIIGPKWLTLNELLETNQARSPLVIKCIQDALAKKRYPLEIIYEHPKND